MGWDKEEQYSSRVATRKANKDPQYQAAKKVEKGAKIASPVGFATFMGGALKGHTKVAVGGLAVSLAANSTEKKARHSQNKVWGKHFDNSLYRRQSSHQGIPTKAKNQVKKYS